MVDHEEFFGAQKLVANHQRPDRVVAGAAACVSDNVSITFGKTCVLSRIQPGIHAGENRETASGWKGKVGLVSKAGLEFG